MRVYLKNVVKVSAPTTQIITDHGLNNYNELTNFTKDNMRTLCVKINCLGDIVMNPQAAVVGQPPTIRDPCHVVLMNMIQVTLSWWSPRNDLCWCPMQQYIKHVRPVLWTPSPCHVTLSLLFPLYGTKNLLAGILITSTSPWTIWVYLSGLSPSILIFVNVTEWKKTRLRGYKPTICPLQVSLHS